MDAGKEPLHAHDAISNCALVKLKYSTLWLKMTNGITDGGLFGFIYIYYVVVTAIIIVRIDFNIIFYLP